MCHWFSSWQACKSFFFSTFFYIHSEWSKAKNQHRQYNICFPWLFDTNLAWDLPHFNHEVLTPFMHGCHFHFFPWNMERFDLKLLDPPQVLPINIIQWEWVYDTHPPPCDENFCQFANFSVLFTLYCCLWYKSIPANSDHSFLSSAQEFFQILCSVLFCLKIDLNNVTLEWHKKSIAIRVANCWMI